MTTLRNPFLIRPAESLEPELFVRLFSADVLDHLPNADHLWQIPLVLRSVAGGGKSSLLRIFSPGALRIVHRHRAQDNFRSLVEKLMTAGALSEHGPRLLGIMLSCGTTYSALDLLSADLGRRRRLLFALLNYRILIASAQAATVLAGLRFPDESSLVSVEGQRLFGQKVSSARELFDIGSSGEQEISSRIDTLSPLTEVDLPGDDDLEALRFLASARFAHSGKDLHDATAVMLDDVHDLTGEQRRALLDALTKGRYGIGVWLAERLQALAPSELISEGAHQNRDLSVVELDRAWREGGNSGFVRFVRNISARRVMQDPDVRDLGDFDSFLDSDDLHRVSPEYAIAVRTKLIDLARQYDRRGVYIRWIEETANKVGSDFAQLVSWRALLIQMERHQRRRQLTFDFEVTPEELNEAATVDAAAELFLHHENERLPYYFGFERLAEISSGNVHQFLAFAGALYEEVSAAVVMKKSGRLSPHRQEILVKREASSLLATLEHRVPNGRAVRRFVDAIGAFCREETYSPTAPYSPGVTGIAISMQDRDRLSSAGSRGADEQYVRLAYLLSTCVAHHILEPKLGHRNKGRDWMLLHLNRALCVYFDLPLHRGGWRERRLDTLIAWMNEGASPNLFRRAGALL
jgi:hypothetical protein